jgi:hypothetical protein
MLPVTVVNSVVDVRLVEIVYVSVVHVDVDVAVAPSASPAPTATPSRAQSQTRPEPKTPSGDVTRIVIRIIGINGWSVDDYRVVRRNIDHLRIGLLDNDHLLSVLDRLRLHFLLRAGF